MPTGLNESDLNGEVTILQGAKLQVAEYNLGLRKGDPNGEVTVRRGSTVLLKNAINTCFVTSVIKMLP